MRRWIVLAVCLAGVGALADPPRLDRVFALRTDEGTVRFNPASDGDLRVLHHDAETWLQGTDEPEKHERRGLEEIERLTKSILAKPGPADRQRLELDLIETTFAVNNLQRPEIPKRFDFIMTPLFFGQFFRPVGVGHKPADNLQPGASEDLSRRDPAPSSFWARPADVAGEDLSIGFGRTAEPDMAGPIWHYYSAKESTGMNPGYEVEADGLRVKLKFGELHSEPVVTRMFWALGFNADPTDFSPAVKVAYDRRIFTEFNSRQPVRTSFTVLWFIPIYSMNLQPHKDPFNYVASAVLRDGRRWSGAQLKAHLLNGTNFIPSVEKQIDYLVTTPANTQARDPKVKSIGPWDYGQLGHDDMREVRGAGLLAAWLGFYDTRFDNTKLRLVGPKKNPRLVHYFSDLGGGMGRAKGQFYWKGENVNEFTWRFTAPAQGRKLRIINYSPIVHNAAFKAMTLDDARWMARLIGQLRPRQITEALAAAGYEGTTLDLYARKLISRRNYMIADLGLSAEFPPLGEN